MSDFDSPWKEALDRFFRLFLAFFFPELEAMLDWERDYESLDTELRKIVPQAEVGARRIDRLVKAYRKDTGDSRLIHVEVQCQREEGFERRMHVYNYRIEDVYNHPVITKVVLGDESPDWRPTEYVYQEHDFRRTLSFVPVKLLDLAGRLEELEKHENPFGVMAAAHLIAGQTRGDVPRRKQEKVRLLKGLYNRGMEAEDLRQWYRYLDWMLDLPSEDDKDVWSEIQKLEEEKIMPFMTFPERYGREVGAKLGKAEGLLAGIQALLRFRFGTEGAALFLEIEKCQEPAKLEAVLQTVESATTLDEIRKVLG